MTYQITSFLYLHYKNPQPKDWHNAAVEALSRVVDRYEILEVEERPDNKETAVKFVTYLQAGSEDEAEEAFRDMFEKQNHDVDNYHLRQV